MHVFFYYDRLRSPIYIIIKSNIKIIQTLHPFDRTSFASILSFSSDSLGPRGASPTVGHSASPYTVYKNMGVFNLPQQTLQKPMSVEQKNEIFQG